WVFASVVVNIVTRVNAMSGSEGVMAKLAKQPIHYYGMLLAHTGMGVFILGVTMVKGFEEEKDVRMELGDVVTMGDYQFRFDGTVKIQGPNFKADRGSILVTQGERAVAVLHPEKRIYNVQQQPMTEAAIESGVFRQLYVSLGEPVGGGAWSVRVYYKPFVTWIWGGAFVMGLGGLLALSDRRYRIANRDVKRAVVEPSATPHGVAPRAVEVKS
ncbi:MAG: cytochrome c-type bioproteinis protein CcmF, partial [Halothiobacillaceae bacterium]